MGSKSRGYPAFEARALLRLNTKSNRDMSTTGTTRESFGGRVSTEDRIVGGSQILVVMATGVNKM